MLQTKAIAGQFALAQKFTFCNTFCQAYDAVGVPQSLACACNFTANSSGGEAMILDISRILFASDIEIQIATPLQYRKYYTMIPKLGLRLNR